MELALLKSQLRRAYHDGCHLNAVMRDFLSGAYQAAVPHAKSQFTPILIFAQESTECLIKGIKRNGAELKMRCFLLCAQAAH